MQQKNMLTRDFLLLQKNKNTLSKGYFRPNKNINPKISGIIKASCSFSFLGLVLADIGLFQLWIFKTYLATYSSTKQFKTIFKDIYFLYKKINKKKIMIFFFIKNFRANFFIWQWLTIFFNGKFRSTSSKKNIVYSQAYF